jgi:ring-1,2-phenylacetyl-CoA epoxidase subunit PaaC
VIRLGDGTEESHSRMKIALQELWQYTGELTTPSTYEQELGKTIGLDHATLKSKWDQRVHEVLSEATLWTYLDQELKNTWMQIGGKEGNHTEYLGYVLAEMQYLQRSYPGAEW